MPEGEEEKKNQLRKGRSPIREKHYWLRREKAFGQLCAHKCYYVFGHAQAKISWGMCIMLALLILNLEQSYTLPFPE